MNRAYSVSEHHTSQLNYKNHLQKVTFNLLIELFTQFQWIISQVDDFVKHIYCDYLISLKWLGVHFNEKSMISLKIYEKVIVYSTAKLVHFLQSY